MENLKGDLERRDRETSLQLEGDGVRATRWRVERMEVDSDKEQASGSKTLDKVVSKAKEGWRKVKQLLEGKSLVREKNSGRVVVKEKVGEKENEEKEVMEEWEENLMGGEVVVEVTTVGEREEGSVASEESKGTIAGFEFLEGMCEDKREEDLEKKRCEGRKRKREQEDGVTKEGGMYGIPGWVWREEEARKDERWTREVMRSQAGKDMMEKTRERIPLPENFALGRDERGVDLNHSGKVKNNFGVNREALIPGGRDKRMDGRNWISSFTKSGCIACRDDKGGVTHKGRKSTPVVLVVGDEAVPTVVGYTPVGAEETSCAWVLKKEHLGLDEVPLLLNRINLDKRKADKERGLREHKFFVPNGSKILVGSYVHLRRAGLEGYVNDFNDMVKSMMSVTGDCGIEILPIVPVVFEGLDQVGRELISGGGNGSSGLEKKVAETGLLSWLKLGGGSMTTWREMR
jgi:hypothetical protein